MNIESNNKSSNSIKKVFVYWDLQNVRFPKKSNPEEPINLVLSLAKLEGNLQDTKVYAYWRKELEKIEEKFHELGFDCISVPDTEKNSADRKIIEDCRKQVLQTSEGNVVVLISGDSDFKSLVNELKSKQHQVLVIGSKQTSLELKQIADCFCALDKLETLIFQKQSQKKLSKTKIFYSDAVECLLKATEAVIGREKSACFSRVDSAMRQMNVLYQGASSICTPEGKTFKCFKKFIEAAVNDGKICLKKQEKSVELVLVKR